MMVKRYRIIEEIGSGGIATVFKALDLLRQKVVAVKVLLLCEPESIERFRGEFVLLKGLSHPNIIQVFDFGFTERQQPYSVMEYVQTIPWEEFRGNSDKSRLHTFLFQVLSTLDFLHSKKIIHGDIKPFNILIAASPEGQPIVKLTDFGFAEYEKDGEVSRWKGTLPYLAPEVIRGEQHTLQADLYSVGILIYEILFGSPPFGEDDPMELAKSHLEKEVVIPQEPPIPIGLKNLILKLLEKDPIDRFFSANEVSSEVQKISGLTFERHQALLVKSLINSADFVGREKELATLKETLDQLRENENRFVLVTGESGIGKKRLLQEFTTWAQVQGFPAISVSLKERSTLEALQDNPFEFLEINSCPVIVFQHLELADDSFFKFISDLTHNSQGRKVMVCFTLTSDLAFLEESQRAVEIEKRIQSICGDSLISIKIGRLTEIEAKDLLSSMFRWKERAETIASVIYRETQGNPFLIRELMESLAEEGKIHRVDDKWATEPEHIEKTKIPQRVQDQIQDRTARSKPNSIELLNCASVWGLEIEFDDLIRMAGFDSALASSYLDNILSHGLMGEVSSSDKKKIRFVNNLFRRFVYEQIDPEKRKILHQRAGEILERKIDSCGETYIYDLANHFYQARDVGRALKYSLLAAERAEGKCDHTQAITHYTHALELRDQIPTLSPRSKEDMFESLADQCDLIGELNTSLDLYQEALQIRRSRTSDHQRLAFIYRKMGRIYEKKGEHGQAVEFFEKSLVKFYASESLKECATTLADLGWVYTRQSNYELAKNQFEKAVAILQKGETSKEMGSALSGLGIIYWALGDYAQASWYHHESLKVFSKLGDTGKIADCYGNLGIVARRRGQLKEAIEYFGKCLDLQKTLQDQYLLSISYNNLGLTYFDLNEWDEALECLRKACEFQEKASDLVGLGLSYNNLGLIYLRKGELTRALEYLDLAISQFQTTRHRSGLALAYYNLGDLYLNREVFSQAFMCLDKSLKIRKELGEETGIADCLALLGRVFFQQSASDQAHQNLLQAQDYHQKQGNRKAEAEVLISLSELFIKTNRLTQAEAFLNQAQELLCQVDNKFLQGIFQRAKASFMKAVGDSDDSVKCLSQSARIFKELRARLELGRTYLEMGRTKLELKRYKEAKGFLMEALNIFQREKNEAKEKEVESLLEQIKNLKILEDERITTFYQLADLVNNIWDTDELLTKSLELAIKLLNAERGAIIFYSDKDKSFEVKISHGIEPETSQDAIAISRQVLKDVVISDSPLIVEDARKDPRFAKSQSVIMYNILSILCVPLRTKNRLIGTVYLDHRSLPAIFSSEDVDFLKAFANLTATAIEKSELYVKANEEIFQLREVLHRTYEYPNIIGKSAKMQEVFNMVEKVANSKTGVLILGENGTGKEIVANLIHERSQRKDSPFIKVNCAALPETLLESELFGIEEKTATGVGSRKGKFELADGGTLFLDEIGDMSFSVQAKVLRAIEEKEFERVGGQKPMKVDVRIISATNMDLHKKIEEGSFRKDLYYRLNPIVITIPPLRERKEDIPFLIDYFVKEFSGENKKPPVTITKRIIDALRDYSWPGNVRELEHLIESAILLSEDDSFPEKLFPQEIKKTKTMINLDRYGKLQEVLNWVEKKKILLTLDKNGWNQSRAAQELGISEPTLRRRMKEHNIKRTVRIRAS